MDGSIRTARIGWVALTVLALGGPALAQQKAAACATPQSSSGSTNAFRLDPNAPVDVHSDSTNFKQDTCTTVFTGNVQVTQKQARLIGHTANAVAAKKGNQCGDMQKIDVDKDVYYVTPDETVRSDHAVYDVPANKVTFTGQVVTVHCDDVATGSRLVIDLKTNEYNMEGPVHAVLTPPPKSANGAAGSSSAPKSAPGGAKPGQ